MFTNRRGYWGHAKQRMYERGISEESVEEAVVKGVARLGNVEGRTVYTLASSESSTGRGMEVVIEDETGDVVTVIDRGSEFEP